MKAFAYNPNRFRNTGRADIDDWLNLYRMINTNVSFVDRTGSITLPIQTAVPKQLQMPKFDPRFRMTYEECCQLKVEQLLEKQEQLDLPIRILYSGGIDSSLILASFIKHLGMEAAQRRLQLVMSVDSIEENPWMWENVIRRADFRIFFGENHANEWSKGRILVGGEFNDQLFGSDIYKDLIRWKGESILTTRWTPDLLLEYNLHKNMTEPSARKWRDIFAEHCQRSPTPIESMADVFWWINFSCKWSAVYFRLLMHVETPEIINQSYLNKYYCQFYGDDYFQQWSMRDREHKHKGTWMSYKWHAKKLVCEFLGDEGFMRKVKRGSLWTLLCYKNPAILIDSGYSYHTAVNLEEIYNANNSFMKSARS